MTKSEILALRDLHNAYLMQEHYNNNVAPVLQENAGVDFKINALESMKEYLSFDYYLENIHDGSNPLSPYNKANTAAKYQSYLTSSIFNLEQNAGIRLNKSGGLIFDHWMDDPTMKPLAENYSGREGYFTTPNTGIQWGETVNPGEYTAGARWEDPVTGRLYIIKEGTHGPGGWDYKAWMDEDFNEIYSTRVQTSDAQGNKYNNWEKLSPTGLLEHLGYTDSSNTPNSANYQSGDLFALGMPLHGNKATEYINPLEKQIKVLSNDFQTPDYEYKPTGTNAQKQREFARFLNTGAGAAFFHNATQDPSDATQLIQNEAKNVKATVLGQALQDKNVSQEDYDRVTTEFFDNYDKNKNANVLEATAHTKYAPKAKTKGQLRAESRKQRYAQGMKGIQDATKDMFVQQQAKDFYTAINPASSRSRQEARNNAPMDFGDVVTMERQFAKGDFGKDFEYDLYNPETGILEHGFYDVLNPTASGKVEFASDLAGSGYGEITAETKTRSSSITPSFTGWKLSNDNRFSGGSLEDPTKSFGVKIGDTVVGLYRGDNQSLATPALTEEYMQAYFPNEKAQGLSNSDIISNALQGTLDFGGGKTRASQFDIPEFVDDYAYQGNSRDMFPDNKVYKRVLQAQQDAVMFMLYGVGQNGETPTAYEALSTLRDAGLPVPEGMDKFYESRGGGRTGTSADVIFKTGYERSSPNTGEGDPIRYADPHPAVTDSGYDPFTLNSLYGSPTVQFRRPEDLDRSKPRTLANNNTYIDGRVFAPNSRTTGFFQHAPIDSPTGSGPDYVSGYSALFDQSGSYPGQSDQIGDVRLQQGAGTNYADVGAIANAPFMYVDEYDADLNPNSPYTPQARKTTYGDYRWTIPDDNYLKFEGMTDPYQEKFGDTSTQRKFKYTGDTGFGATTGGRSDYSGGLARLNKYGGRSQNRLTDYSGISSRDALYEDFEDNII